MSAMPLEAVPVPEPAAEARSLAGLALGQAGLIVAVEVPEPLRERLLDLGFTPGTFVRLVRRAPLGDPSVYELRGMQLCLRRSEAAGVRVRPAPETAGG